MKMKFVKIIIPFASIWVFTILFTVFSSLTCGLKQSEATPSKAASQSTGQTEKDISEKNNGVARDPKKGVMIGRTLKEYYSRRQYPGSPPEIAHPVEVHGEKLACLLCHADGGWTAFLKSITPVTPHPEHISCIQCHVRSVTDDLFKAIDWQSVPPPGLGRAYLPGAPPPIPHDLQMRRNCIACHVGSGTVAPIRVEHASWGSCRQCHVPDTSVEPFRRD